MLWASRNHETLASCRHMSVAEWCTLHLIKSARQALPASLQSTLVRNGMRTRIRKARTRVSAGRPSEPECFLGCRSAQNQSKLAFCPKLSSAIGEQTAIQACVIQAHGIQEWIQACVIPSCTILFPAFAILTQCDQRGLAYVRFADLGGLCLLVSLHSFQGLVFGIQDFRV